MSALIVFGIFTVLLLLNVPIALALAFSSIASLIYEELPFSMIPSNLYSSTGKFVLLAIPFFILGGNVMEKSGISTRLIEFCRTLVGHRKGGMALVCVIVACFFAAISGSGPATVAALGMILIPAMTDTGYEKGYATALVTSAGAIGIVIPPSITFVVYGSITGKSVGALFASGIGPGVLIGFMLVVAMQMVSRKRKLTLLPKATMKERWVAFKDAFWGLLMPVIILGGIYGGFFTPTEAAAVAAAYGLFVALFIYRSMTFKDILPLVRGTVSQTAVVMYIVGAASLFSWILTVTGIAADSSNLLISLCGGNKYIFLLIVNIILLIAGCFIDPSSACYILVPILYPVAMMLGIDGVHLGAIMVANLSIGLITPPVGTNLYVGCGIANINLKEMSRCVLPFIISGIIAVLLTTYVPAFSMFLPSFLN